MKNELRILVSASLLLSASLAKSQTKATDITIKTVKQGQKPPQIQHKHHDVAVYRMTGAGNQYVVDCYIAHGAELRSIKRYVSEKERMRRANITWVNDTTAAVHLYNPATGRSSDFTFP